MSAGMTINIRPEHWIDTPDIGAIYALRIKSVERSTDILGNITIKAEWVRIGMALEVEPEPPATAPSSIIVQ